MMSRGPVGEANKSELGLETVGKGRGVMKHLQQFATDSFTLLMWWYQTKQSSPSPKIHGHWVLSLSVRLRLPGSLYSSSGLITFNWLWAFS